jgi:prepilin-type N-terminal cleavage/methylation domain-containing protein
MKIRRRGFTLVEVLIVVIIIAILAALLMPRMVAQTGKAQAAEAQQMLGTIQRALWAYADTTGGSWPACTGGSATAQCDAASWSAIGITPPSSNLFTYWWDTNNNTVKAYGKSGGLGTGAYIYLNSTGFSCDGTTFVNMTTSSSQGCTKA